MRSNWIYGLVASFLATSTAGAELTAVVTQTEQKITLDSGRDVRSLEILELGTKIHVPKEGRVGLICSNDRWVELSGTTDWKLTHENCADDGREVDPGTYKSLAPRGGRFRTVEGVLVMERDTRDIPTAAILLSPRNTKVRDARPEIRWRSQDGAIEYEITLEGADPLRLQAQKVSCRPEPDWNGEEVCTLPWPEAHSLAPGASTRINVGYRTSRTGPFERDDTTGLGRPVQRLSESNDKELAQRLERLNPFGESTPARALAEAGLFAGYGLYADATLAYKKTQTTNGIAVRVTLGDLYFKIGLFGLANNEYKPALNESDPALQAAATFGMGRLHFAVHNFAEAEELFAYARQMFTTAGLQEEAKAAADMVSESVKRKTH